MHRPPSLPYDDSSSLDPLAVSVDGAECIATRRSSSPANRLPSSPLKPSRSTKKSNERSTPDGKTHNNRTSFNPISPSRTVTEQTLSPWKIRVTVEAEPEDSQADGIPMTRTVKIPLRQGSSPLPQGEHPARGRKVQSSPAKKKRSATPVRQRSNSRSRPQSVTDLDVRPLGDDNDSDEWTDKRNSTRKPSSRRGRRSKSAQVEDQKAGFGPEDQEVPVRPSLQSTRGLKAFQIQEDENLADEAAAVYDADSPELREIDLNQVSMRHRSQSMKRKEGTELSNQEASAKKPPPETLSSARKVSAKSNMSYPTPSPTSSHPGSSDEQREENGAKEDENVGFDTIMESEGFTMIDLDTIPSVRQYLSSPSESVNEAPVAESKESEQIDKSGKKRQGQTMLRPSLPAKLSPIPKRLLPTDDSSELSSYVASSPPNAFQNLLNVPMQRPITGQRKVTPEPYSSPKLPSPPQQSSRASASANKALSPPEEVVNAGVALQTAVDSDKPSIAPSRDKTINTGTDSEHEQFFEGFSSGTKRELRAGLRFGEELAKRQNRSLLCRISGREDGQPANTTRDNKNVNPQLQPDTSTQVWRGETTVQHSPFMVASGDQRNKIHQLGMRAKVESSLLSQNRDVVEPTFGKESSSLQTPQTSSFTTQRGIISTQARREHEWQLEREAVSREIENASPSKVIVIDGDSDEENRKGENLERSEASESRLSESHQSEEKPSNTHGNIRSSLMQERSGGDHITDAALEFHNISDEDNDDIWLQEAQNNSSSPHNEQDILFTRSEQRHQRERAAEAVSKPRRSVIPSPWKRGENVTDASTFISNGDMSGMLWNAEKEIKFGAGAITRQNGSAGGNFDLKTMLTSPTKLATTGRKNLSLRTDNHQSSESDEGYGGSVSEDEQEDTGFVDEEEASPNGSQHEQSSLGDEQSVPSSPPAVQKVPVNFNDSTLSQQATPQCLRSSLADDAEDRPSTPRSAMKGSRQSMELNEHNSPIRRVVFSERSMYLNEDGEESSMSAKLDSPQAELTNSLEKSIDGQLGEDNDTNPNNNSSHGWMGWLWRGQPDSSSVQNTSSTTDVDGTADAAKEKEEEWQDTKTTVARMLPASHIITKKPRRPKQKVPSYLLPPSYPSDPTRDISIPLATGGSFTDSHFRTLHIIHLKSFQPRFHAPKHIRPELERLAGWGMTVDENAVGLGEFEWKADEVEIQVLERFMQEVEEGWKQVGQQCQWAWSMEELAKWLGMLAVGDVVRKEEGQRM